MSTTLYLKDTKLNAISVYRDMVTAVGSSAVTSVVNTVAGGTQIQWSKVGGGELMTWISGRSPAGGWTFALQSTFSIWARESHSAANCGIRVRLYKRTAGGTETEIGSGWAYGSPTELNSSTLTEYVWNGTPPSTAFAEDDRLIIRAYIINVGTMGGGRTCTLSYSGPTAATGDSFLQIGETISFKSDSVDSPKTVDDDVAVATYSKPVVSPVAPHATENISVSDYQKTVLSPLAAHLSDSAGISESKSTSVPSTKAPFDALSIGDVIQRTSLTDAPLKVSEYAFAFLRPMPKEANVHDDIGGSDFAERQSQFVEKIFSDGIGVIDSAHPAVSPLLAAKQESGQVFEQIQRQIYTDGPAKVRDAVTASLHSLFLQVGVQESITSSDYHKDVIPITVNLWDWLDLWDEGSGNLEIAGANANVIDLAGVVDDVSGNLLTIHLHPAVYDPAGVSEAIQGKCYAPALAVNVHEWVYAQTTQGEG